MTFVLFRLARSLPPFVSLPSYRALLPRTSIAQHREFLREIKKARDAQTQAVARRARLLEHKPFPHPRPWDDSPLLDPERERRANRRWLVLSPCYSPVNETAAATHNTLAPQQSDMFLFLKLADVCLLNRKINWENTLSMVLLASAEYRLELVHSARAYWERKTGGHAPPKRLRAPSVE